MAGPVVERGLCLEQSETIAKVSGSPSEVVAARRARRSGGAPRKAMAHGWTRRHGVPVAWLSHCRHGLTVWSPAGTLKTCKAGSR